MEERYGIGARIKQLRAAKGMTQAQLAKMLNVTREKVNFWENEIRDIKSTDIVLLADTLGTTCDYLLRGIAPENVTIASELGLSNKSIEKLKYMAIPEDPEIKHSAFAVFNECINLLLESENGLSVLADIHHFLLCDPEKNSGVLEDYAEDGSILYHNFDRFSELMLFYGKPKDKQMPPATAYIYSEDILSMLLVNINNTLKNWRDEIQNAKKDE